MVQQSATAKKQTIEGIRISKEEIDVLKNCIKYSNPTTARWLSLIIAHFQIQTSRTEAALNTVNATTPPTAAASSALQWILLRELIGHLFEFSRTGQLPSEILDNSGIVFPIHASQTGPVFNNWGKAYQRLTNYHANNGGWTSKAFQARLKI